MRYKNSSMTIYPENTCSNYINTLPRKISATRVAQFNMVVLRLCPNGKFHHTV